MYFGYWPHIFFKHYFSTHLSDFEAVVFVVFFKNCHVMANAFPCTEE
mgnify:CR=1 FL=1